jgi:DNA-binding transcriptional LysR family regulator
LTFQISDNGTDWKFQNKADILESNREKEAVLLLKLEYFYYMIEIAEVGAINRAAENLYMSQPYLSLSLKELEGTLGIRLFDRTRKGVVLTRAGEEFLEYSRQIVSLAEKAGNLKQRYTSAVQKLVILSMPSFTIVDLFHDFFAANASEQNEICYEEMPNPAVSERMQRQEGNIGIFYISSREYPAFIRLFSEKKLNFVPLVNEPLYAVVNNRNRLAGRNSLSVHELDQLNFLVESIKLPARSGSYENNPFPEIFKRGTRETIKFNNNRSMLYYLTKSDNSFCVGQKSLNLTNPFVQSGQLFYIPITGLTSTLITGYLTSDNAESSPLEEAFIDHLERFFATHQALVFPDT